MSAFLDVIKAAVLLTKIALNAGASEKNDAVKKPPADRAKPPEKPVSNTPPEWIKSAKVFPVKYINNGDFKLEPNDTGSEYSAVIKGVQTQDIVVPDNYDGFSVTEIKMTGGGVYDNKARLFVPKTVKKLDLGVVLCSSDSKSVGRWIKVIIDEENPYFVTQNRCVYSKDMTVLWCAQCKTNYFTVPDTVTTIADHAFTGNRHIVEVKLPPSVKKIGNGAFYQCGNLRNINVENVVSIGKEAFYNCEKIRDFICEDLRDIGDRCFGSNRCFGVYHGSLYTVKLPSTLEKIGTDVFPYVISITIYDNLKAPLRSFANNPYCVTVRSAESGEIKFKICIDGDAPKIIQEWFFFGWKEYAEFNFEEFDRFFKTHYRYDDRSARKFYLTAAQLRLCYPYKLTDSAREYYKKILTGDPIPVTWCFHGECNIGDFSALFREKIKGVSDIAKLIDTLDTLPGDERILKKYYRLDANKVSDLKEKIFLMIEEFCRGGIYSVDDLYELTDIFTEKGRTEYTARIMELRNSVFPYEDRLVLE